MARVAQTIPVPLTIARFSTSCEKINRVRCLACHLPLDLNQPVAELPERLIGVCEGCDRWYLLECVRHLREIVMVLLPEPGRIADGVDPPPP